MEYNDIEFSLTDNFINKYKGKQPKWGPLGYFTFKRTYAKLLSNGKTEEFWQTLKRVVECTFLVQKMHCQSQHIPWDNRKAQISAQEMYRRMWEFKFLPPGRGLDHMGWVPWKEEENGSIAHLDPLIFLKGGACLNNCGFVSTKDIHTDFSGPFTWLMEMSLYGVGVGFDTVGADSEVFLKKPRYSKEPHIAEDSREGWVECFRRILDAFVGADTLPSDWDFTQIRKAGEPIKTFGGVAPGPGPLKELVERTQSILTQYLESESPVDSTLIVDLMNFAGAAVVAGGIRRTAEIAFGDINDEEFGNLKLPEFRDNPNLARWASNNSYRVESGDDYRNLAARSAIDGEPGFFWLDTARRYGRLVDPPNGKDRRVLGCNPCGEQSLENFELCNLVETFPSNHESLSDYLRTLKFAYLYAKTVTLIKTHDQRTNSVMLRNRRIGLSQSGIVEQIKKVGFRKHMEWCDRGYEEVKKWDEIYSEWLCIGPSIKKTTVKPSGTVSLLPGVTPGVHHPHSEFYIRRIRVAAQSSLWEEMKKAGYHVEPDVNLPDTTMVVSFPVKETHFERRKEDVSMWEQFKLASEMQHWWSDNQVSITITVKPEEAKDLSHALSMYDTTLKAVSFLPLDPSAAYKQAPYEEITESVYNEMIKGLKKPKLNLTEEIDRVEDKFCDGDSCTI